MICPKCNEEIHVSPKGFDVYCRYFKCDNCGNDVYELLKDEIVGKVLWELQMQIDSIKMELSNIPSDDSLF